MTGWILIGEKSSKLKDLEIFINAFNENGLKLEKIFAKDINVMVSNNNTIFINNEEKNIPKFIVSAFFGNNDYHNLSVVRMFESLGILCINGYNCLIDTTDKMKSFHIIKQKVPTAILPKTILYNSALSETFLQNQISFPMIVKINGGAKGNGVEIANSYLQLLEIITDFKHTYNDEILLQEYIYNSYGQDLRIILCGGKYITSFIRANKNSFKSNLALGGTLEFFKPPQEIIEIAESIAKSLTINLGSVDFLLSENKYILCEANSMPGLSYVEAARKANIKNPLLDIIENIKKQIQY